MAETRKISFREAIKEALEEELARDPRLIAVGDDVREGRARSPAITEELKVKFPDRIINRMPLVEEMLCGIGLGMSVGGLKPIVQFDHGTFIPLALHELHRLGIWRYRMNEKGGPGIVVRIGHGGYSADGAEFSASHLAHILHLPNVWIATPSYAYHAKGLLKSAIRANRPVVFVEHKHSSIYYREEMVPSEEYLVPFGTSVKVKTGKDITIVAWMLMAHSAFAATELLLKNEQIEAEVISLQTLYPMDMPAILDSARKTGRVLVVDEEMERGGIAAEICARLAAQLPGCRLERLAAKNVPLPANVVCQKYVLPTIEDIADACKQIVRKPA